MIDPRLKIIFGSSLILLTALTPELQNGIVLLGCAFLLTLFSHIKWSKYLRRFLMINSFAFFLIPFIIFTKEGATAFTMGPLTASIPGINQSLLIIVKLNTIILFLFATYLSMELIEIGKSLLSLRLNKKLIYILFFCCRYLTLLKEELQRIYHSVKARGFKASNNFHSYRTIAYIFGSLLLSSLDRAERIHQAMICRGFNGQFHSTNQLNLKIKDYIYILLMSALTFFTIWIQYVYQH